VAASRLTKLWRERVTEHLDSKITGLFETRPAHEEFLWEHGYVAGLKAAAKLMDEAEQDIEG